MAAVLDTSTRLATLAALPALARAPITAMKGAWYQEILGAAWRRGIRPIAVLGRDRVEGLRYRDGSGREHETACDAVAMGYGLKPETQLAELAGATFAFNEPTGQWLPRTSPPGVVVAGDGAGILGADAAEIAGRNAGLAIAAELGRRVPSSATLTRHRAFRAGLERAFPVPVDLAAAMPDDTILCRCEGVRAGEFRAVDAGEINRAKALSRVGMGRCQGRVCGFAACHVLAAARGVPVEQVGRLRIQAPVKPLPLAACQP